MARILDWHAGVATVSRGQTLDIRLLTTSRLNSLDSYQIHSQLPAVHMTRMAHSRPWHAPRVVPHVEALVDAEHIRSDEASAPRGRRRVPGPTHPDIH